MKKKLVESSIPAALPKGKTGFWITAQREKDILILNIYNNKVLKARHCINVDTYEYATFKDGTWHQTRMEDAVGFERYGDGYRWSSGEGKRREKISADDNKLVLDSLRKKGTPTWIGKAYQILDHAEMKYNQNRRDQAEERRQNRIRAVMDKIPPIPAGIKEWINQKEIGGEDYALKAKEKGIYGCSHCGNKFSKSKIARADGEKQIRNKDMVICPSCKKEVRFLNRRERVDIITHFALAQPIDDTMSVMRYFDAEIYCTGEGKKQIGIDEAVRIILFKNPKEKTCHIYYNQFARGWHWSRVGIYDAGCFDDWKNPMNRREFSGYLYADDIKEVFRDTAYEAWTRLFSEMAAADMKLDYNRMMCMYKNGNYIRLVEMLFRGRFYKLLKTTSERTGHWGSYYGCLRLEGNTIEDVFDIGDRQRINRIRDKDGGENMVRWMRWSERHHTKISDKALDWLVKNNLTEGEMAWTKCRFSLEQAMNYIERQRRESYKGKSTKQVISQYEDYMAMCEKLGKDTADEMVYRPRELKRRHDEAVIAIERLNAEIKADEYSEKFGEAEAVLQAIREKFEYAGEEYFIIVPQRIVDIVLEGNYLHHCAGATDRYFDRIKQHETYICFLRKVKEPDIPFYTIEVEPGGTIRQHRGMFDEEPDIEKIKPFLREWQKAIRKRMSRKDHELAAASKIKREENIKELKEKNNTRVLNGLMEDFMEAVEGGQYGTVGIQQIV